MFNNSHNDLNDSNSSNNLNDSDNEHSQSNNQPNNLLQHNKPDIIIESSDKTDFVHTSLPNASDTASSNRLMHNDSHKIDNNEDTFHFGVHTPSKCTSNTDSESDDLCSDASTSDRYKSPEPIIKSNHQSTSRLVEKNNELNKNDGGGSPIKSYSIKDDLKISIDNSDWLRKRRPLVADIDLDQHFETINDQLMFKQSNESFEQDQKIGLHKQSELNKENYCNGQVVTGHSKPDAHLIKDQPQLANLDVLSTSSSSNHSPNSYSDELDANKIELRSVIRNIMCKNLGSSSDKSSTMSEEDETDEDENSVDCKAKLNDIKPAIKNLQSTIEHHQENELNKSKEKSILTNKLSTINGLAARYDDSVDEKEDSENYDSQNSEERTDELSSKDDISHSNTDLRADDPKKCSKSSLKQQFGKKKIRRVSFDPLALFLDAALEGELELVKKTATQVGVTDLKRYLFALLLIYLCIHRYQIRVHHRKE